MDIDSFRKSAHRLVDWMADYFQSVETYPVKSQVKPGATYDKLPSSAPEKGESMDAIFRDFQEIIVPGMTHWQHPGFHAYFNGNSSYPSVLAEMLTATLAAQCMIWETSPAATELEEKMMDWLKDLLHLPHAWQGVIHDTASTATLVSLITARETHTGWKINKKGFQGNERFRIYASKQSHSSVEKAVRIAGLGSDNLVLIDVDKQYSLSIADLKDKVKADLKAGFIPLWMVATLGSTGSTAVDPLKEVTEVCKQYKIWLHVDAAWAGTAMMLPEYQWLRQGLEAADSFVFNPHKWMFTNFDCTAYFVRDAESLQRTFTLIPEYLKTRSHGRVNNYSDWGIQLGRRFRALKLWFVLRNFGKEGLRKKVANHIKWAQDLATDIDRHPQFELLAPAPLATVCFRYRPPEVSDDDLNALNEKLLHELNQSGKIYLTHTKLADIYTIRLVVGQTYQQKHHIDKAWEIILVTACQLS
ncbi:MAG: pyridoxal-dependent decarboxylase [Cyclobacteriaceae bacterium]|nr:pyridoxal-dependent decarboxylase [Cyclobacteriaceae bacterium]